MVSITLKRSAATLGVVAGLLAAAGPASAQIAPATTGTLHAGYTPPIGTDKGSLIILAGTADDQMLLTGSKAPRANSGEVAMESVTQLNDVEAIDFNSIDSGPGDDN